MYVLSWTVECAPETLNVQTQYITSSALADIVHFKFNPEAQYMKLF